MSEGVPEGATLPEGIEVDDAAAYFGVVDSSDVLQQMMSMDSKQALSKALEHLADIILRPGEFDFEAASERLQCEGGEIYFDFWSSEPHGTPRPLAPICRSSRFDRRSEYSTSSRYGRCRPSTLALV